MVLDPRLTRQARPVRAWLMLSIGLGLSAGLVTVLQALLLSRVVARVFLGGQSLSQVAGLLGGLLAVAILRAAGVWGSEAAAGRAAGQVRLDLRQMLLERLLALGPAYARGERSGELVNTAVEGIETLDGYFSQYLPQLALAALSPLAVLLVVFPLDWLSGVVLLLTAPLIPVFMALIGSLADRLARRQWTSLSRLSAFFMDVLQGLTTLKLLGQSREQAAAIGHVSDRFRQATMNVLRVAFLSALVQEMVATLSTAVVAVEIGLRLLYGRLAFEQAFFILVLAPELYMPLRLLGTRFHASLSGLAAARRIWEIIDAAPEPHVQAEPKVSGGACPAPALFSPAPFSCLVFDSVSYTYAGSDRAALQDVSFRIDVGCKVALVGPSGAGKSTVAQLILRFIEPHQGDILAGGRSLRTMSPQEWRAQVAWAPQNPYLFNRTVAENIALGRPDASREAIVRAAKLARAHDFIHRLPRGYDTLIGERGARLSGGQAQRLALARALVRDAPVLILDEPTSNLDPEHEALVQQALQALTPGRMTLVIAHRLSTVISADEILVMDAGRIIQRGAHAALAAEPGVYRRLVSAYVGDRPAMQPEAG